MLTSSSLRFLSYSLPVRVPNLPLICLNFIDDHSLTNNNDNSNNSNTNKRPQRRYLFTSSSPSPEQDCLGPVLHVPFLLLLSLFRLLYTFLMMVGRQGIKFVVKASENADVEVRFKRRGRESVVRANCIWKEVYEDGGETKGKKIRFDL